MDSLCNSTLPIPHLTTMLKLPCFSHSLLCPYLRLLSPVEPIDGASYLVSLPLDVPQSTLRICSINLLKTLPVVTSPIRSSVLPPNTVQIPGLTDSQESTLTLAPYSPGGTQMMNLDATSLCLCEVPPPKKAFLHPISSETQFVWHFLHNTVRL